MDRQPHPPAHPEDGGGVISRNVGKPSHLEAAVLKKKFIEFCRHENFKIYILTLVAAIRR